MTYKTEAEVFTDGDSEATLLADAKWLLSILTEEIPSRKNNIKTVLQCLPRVLELETKVAELITNKEEQEAALALAIQEKQDQENTIKALVHQVEELKKKTEFQQSNFQNQLSLVTKEKNQYAQEVLELKEELRRRGELLVDIPGVKKALQRIFSALQGKKDNSSTHN